MKSILGLSFLFLSLQTASARALWTVNEANQWYQGQHWLVGSNFIPEDAENAIEMWQAETFNPLEIDRELTWAESLGFTTMRVFLHDLVWQQDPKGFSRRIDIFLSLCAKHKIRPLLVLFDSCWDPHPKLGIQPKPVPGVHNSRWVQSPGLDALKDPAEYPRLENYVKGVIQAFSQDSRILGWDLWNEPDNLNGDSYSDPVEKLTFVQTLLPQVFTWARSVNPVQPLTSGVWGGDWSSATTLRAIEKIQISLSDVITFHNYGKADDFDTRAKQLKRYGRPVICTEYMARPLGSTFQNILPVAKTNQVGAMNWGFVAGKTQTYIPWDSWQTPYPASGPLVWFHDIFHGDGTPYDASEVQFLRTILSKSHF